MEYSCPHPDGFSQNIPTGAHTAARRSRLGHEDSVLRRGSMPHLGRGSNFPASMNEAGELAQGAEALYSTELLNRTVFLRV